MYGLEMIYTNIAKQNKIKFGQDKIKLNEIKSERNKIWIK